MTRVCHKCGTPWAGPPRPDFKAECPKCLSYVHCCKNCRLHDRFAHNQCKSPTTDPVQDREGANFCDEFDWKHTDATQERAPRESTKDKWDKLFGGK